MIEAPDRGPSGAANGDEPGWYVGRCRPDWLWTPTGPTHHPTWSAAADALDAMSGRVGDQAAICGDIPARTRGWAGARLLSEQRYEYGPDGWLLLAVMRPVLLRPSGATQS